MRKLLPILLLLAWCAPALGQGSPNFTGRSEGNTNPLTAAALNSAFVAKQDYGGDVSTSYAHATGSSTTRTIADWMSDITPPSLAMPSQFSVSNPSSGSAISVGWAVNGQNTFLATPAASTGAPAFRAITTGDLPFGSGASGQILTGAAGGSWSNSFTLGDGSTTEQWVFIPTPTTEPTGGGAASLMTLTNSGSGGGSYINHLVKNQLTLTGAPNNFWWVHINILDWSGTGGTGQHVAGYDQTNRYAYSSGGASNNPQLWAKVAELNDFTAQPSLATNDNITQEFDLRGHNVDNANNRQALSIVVQPALDNANYFEAVNPIGVTVSPGAYVKAFEDWGGAYTVAALDMRYAASYAQNTSSLSTPTYPTVTSAVSASATVPVSNVMPFTSDIYRRDINTGHTNTVYFSDGQSATVTGYSITGSGGTPSGTLTLSAPITLASGVTVYNNSKAIWLGTGFQVALDTGGSTYLYSDGSVIHAVASGGFNPAGGMKLPIKTVATLPTCNSGEAGVMMAVSDAASPSYNGTLTGGGSSEIPVFCNGSAWTSH